MTVEVCRIGGGASRMSPPPPSSTASNHHKEEISLPNVAHLQMLGVNSNESMASVSHNAAAVAAAAHLQIMGMNAAAAASRDLLSNSLVASNQRHSPPVAGLLDAHHRLSPNRLLHSSSPNHHLHQQQHHLRRSSSRSPPLSNHHRGGNPSGSPHHDSSEIPTSRPKFMITDILRGSSDQQPKDMRITSPSSTPSLHHHHHQTGGLHPSLASLHHHHLSSSHDVDEDVDLEGDDVSHDDDDDMDNNKSEDNGEGRSGQPPCKKQRKARTAFSDNQLQTLEKNFERQKYLSVQDRMELASKLGLTDTQVKTWYQNRRTKWKRQTAVGLELLAEAGNFAAVQRLYGSPGGYCPTWPYPPPQSMNPSIAASAAAAAALSISPVDLYYRQAAAAAALQKPMAFRLYPPGLQLLTPPAGGSDPLRDALRPESLHNDVLRLDALRNSAEALRSEALRSSADALRTQSEALRSDILRPEALRGGLSLAATYASLGSVPSIASSLSLPTSSLTVTASLPASPLSSPHSSTSPLSASGSPLPNQTVSNFYRSEAASQV